MGNPPERQKTTEYAKEKIDFFLKNKEYSLALLLSHIYVGIRLRSLLTDWAGPPKEKWKKTSKIFGRIGFRGCIVMCNQLGLLENHEREKLDELAKKRNDAAHESRIWKDKLQQVEEKRIERLCESAIQFMERTSR